MVQTILFISIVLAWLFVVIGVAFGYDWLWGKGWRDKEEERFFGKRKS